MIARQLGFALLLGTFVSGPASAEAAPEMLLRGRCNQGECSFTKIISTQTIGKNDAGYMLLVKERSAIVTTSKNDSNPENVKAPKYFGLVKVGNIFCSTQKPATIFYSDKRFYAHVLNIGEPAPGFAVDSHIEYWAACHNRIVSVSDVMGGALVKDAAALGYHKVPEANQGQYDFRSRKKAFRFFGL
jgi:hypothetical protein